MNFWGVEVKAGQPVKCDPATDGKLLRLSQASLGEATKDKGSDSVIVAVKVGDLRVVIGTLSSQKCPHMKFDLVFEKEFELSHDWKHGSVHFCGYYTKPKPASIKPNDDSDDKESGKEDSDGDKDMIEAGDDSDDDDEDEESHDDESSEEDEAIPKKVETSKKKPVESVTKTPLPEKKAKLVAQSSQESGESNHGRVQI